MAKQRNYRLTDEEHASVERLAATIGRTNADAIRAAIPSEAIRAAFAYSRLMGLGGEDYRAWFEAKLVQAVRNEMLNDPTCPLDPAEFPPAGATGRVLQLYVRWLACRDLLAGIDRVAVDTAYREATGRPLDFHAERVPGCDRWRIVPDARPVPVVTVADMLRDLRSDDAATRIRAGLRLAAAIGVGLKLAGEHREDVEHLIGPQLADVLGRAMTGDAAAVDELERLITTTPPPAVMEPSAEARELSKHLPGELLDMIEAEEDVERRRTLVEAFFVSLGRHADQPTPTPEVERLFGLADKLCKADAEAMQTARAVAANMEVKRATGQ